MSFPVFALLASTALPVTDTVGASITPDSSARDVPPVVASARDSAQGVSRDTTSAPKVPFGFGDFTWMNGQSRQKDFPLQLGKYVTASIYLDTYFAYSGNRPRDHTLTGSASVGRHNEFQINLASVGLSWNYRNVIGTFSLQTGNMLNIVQDLDGTVARGRNLTSTNLRNIREANVGYHFDKWYGVDVTAGIFMSYIGLESYLLAENWNYHRSLVCDFTPFYFQGVRASIYPNEKLKIEPWIMNGFQTYGKWNEQPAVGLSTYYRPTEWLGLIGNVYYGTDTKNTAARKRFHHDNSILLRYANAPQSKGISKAAFSLNTHYGFEQGGGGPERKDAYMAGTSFVNRVWFNRDKLAAAVRLETINNPTRYLAPAPTSAGFTDPGTALRINGVTTTFDIMPTDIFSFRMEWTGRRSNVPFFAGRNGTTSADGYQGTPTAFTPDVSKKQNLFVASLNFRL